MKKSNAIPWWGWFAWFLAITIGIVAYNHLPAQVATHYNLAGKANAWARVWKPFWSNLQPCSASFSYGMCFGGLIRRKETTSPSGRLIDILVA